MAKKRDIIEEIRAKRTRTLKRGPRWILANRRIGALFEAHELLLKNPQLGRTGRLELVRYVPVGLVACLEGYYRSVIRDLIDSGAPYRENARRLDEIRLDLATVLGMERGAVSIGEFVSHLLPISSLSDVNKHLSILSGADYLNEVRNSRLLHGLPDTLMEVYPDVFADVEDVFKQRHIAVHELALKQRLTFSRSQAHLNAVLFLTLADDNYWETKHSPLTD